MVHDDARRPRFARRRADSGFTLIETMFAMALFAILVGIAMGPYHAYRDKQEHKAATRDLVAFLRRAQVRAVSEETTYRVDIAAGGRTAKSFRLNGTSYVAGQVVETGSAKITFNPNFSGGSVFFYARGSATRGSVTVVRAGSEKSYTIDVEGLTARVSYK